MLLYIIRHGDPNYEDDCLTPKGILQAEAVGKRIAASGIDRIFSSPMGRARQTAEPACRLLGLNYTVEDWAHEIEDERMTIDPNGVRKSISYIQNSLFRENGSINVPYEDTMKVPYMSITQMDKACKRIWDGGVDFLERLGYKEENGVYKILRPNEEKVALFCHSAFARAWLSMLLHIPLHIMWAGFDYCHTGVTILEFKNYENGITAPKCRCYSDLSHFYKDGPDMVYNNTLSI